MDKIVAKRWTCKHQSLIETLINDLETNHRPHIIKLLNQIISRTEKSEVYRNKVITWLNGDANISDFEEICSPFFHKHDVAMRNNIFLLNRTFLIHS